MTNFITEQESKNKNNITTITRNDLYQNYKVMEDIYIEQGKARKFISGSGVFDNNNNNSNNVNSLKFFLIVSPKNNLDDSTSRLREFNQYEKNSNEILENKLQNMQNILKLKFEKEFNSTAAINYGTFGNLKEKENKLKVTVEDKEEDTMLIKKILKEREEEIQRIKRKIENGFKENNNLKEICREENSPIEYKKELLLEHKTNDSRADLLSYQIIRNKFKQEKSKIEYKRSFEDITPRIKDFCNEKDELKVKDDPSIFSNSPDKLKNHNHNRNLSQPDYQVVNLREINQKLKSFTKCNNAGSRNKQSFDNTNNNNSTNTVSLISCQTSKDQMVQRNDNLFERLTKQDSKQILTNDKLHTYNSPLLNKKAKVILYIPYPPMNNNREELGIPNCLSLKTIKPPYSNMKEFGKFITQFIGKEEHYKALLENNIRKFKKTILNTFTKYNKNDHCLLDYLIELWDKIEVSFQVRFKILNDLTKTNNVFKIYSTLDSETEVLSQYYNYSQDVYSLIKDREKRKSKIQAKIKKGLRSQEDFEIIKKLTKDTILKLKQFKEKYNFDITWRGNLYENVKLFHIYFLKIINYENWLAK